MAKPKKVEQEAAASAAEDANVTPLYGGDNVTGGPADVNFDQFRAIDENNPPPNPLADASTDAHYDPYSEARWAGHDLSPAPVNDPRAEGGQAFRLRNEPGLVSTGVEPDFSAVEAADTSDVVSDEDPSGPAGGNLDADPVAAHNYWGVVTEQNPETGDEPLSPEPETQVQIGEADQNDSSEVTDEATSSDANVGGVTATEPQAGDTADETAQPGPADTSAESAPIDEAPVDETTPAE